MQNHATEKAFVLHRIFYTNVLTRERSCKFWFSVIQWNQLWNYWVNTTFIEFKKVSLCLSNAYMHIVPCKIVFLIYLKSLGPLVYKKQSTLPCNYKRKMNLNSSIVAIFTQFFKAFSPNLINWIRWYSNGDGYVLWTKSIQEKRNEREKKGSNQNGYFSFNKKNGHVKSNNKYPAKVFRFF